jgi:hypothetical protein
MILLAYSRTIVWVEYCMATILDYVEMRWLRSTLEAHIYVKKFRYNWNYQKINKIDSGGLTVVHFVISSNANMCERLDWRKSAKRWAKSV